MKLLAFAGSLSRDSINGKLVAVALDIIANDHRSDIDVDLLDLNDYEMALYSPERQAVGIPPEAQRFYDKIGDADGILMSLPEYNGSYSAAFKNVFDWVSRIDRQMYQHKPTVILAASPGPRAGAGVLGSATMTAPFFGADLRGSLGVGSFHDNYDPATKTLTNPELRHELSAVLGALFTDPAVNPA
ncbi:MAG: NAD(P)H-dependent oxidoreductase [Acidimicrobiales bacterium]